MKTAELAEQCVKAINFGGDDAERATITIVLPKRWKAPPKFPKRELLCENANGENVYSCSAMNVLAWLAANGLVNIASASGPKPDADYSVS